jgi:uncharacterized protein (TIGR00251 family)
VFAIDASREGAVLKVRLRPAAPRAGLVGEHGDGSLKATVRAAPERGRANEELLALLAEALDLPRGAVELLAGEASREKRVRFRGVAAEDLRGRLARALEAK